MEQLEQLVTIQHWLAGLWFLPDDAPYFLAEIEDADPAGENDSPSTHRALHSAPDLSMCLV